jgi:hypothetical protein
MAMDILPIQPAAVGCEHIFSSSAQTITDHRNRLATKTLEALQVLKFEYKQARDLVRMWLPCEYDVKAMELVAESELDKDVANFVQYLRM